jgi:hypothetical protein
MDLFNEQKMYLAARLKECTKRPDLNAYMKKVIEEHIAKANASASFEEYTSWAETKGNYFDIAQAEQQDRYSNLIKIQQFYKNKKREEYFAKKLETVNQATDHRSLSGNLTDIEPKIQVEEQHSWQAMQEVLNMHLKIVEYITVADVDRKDKLNEIKTKWAKLKELDPEINLEKIINYPPYRHVSIFDNERIVELFGNIREVMQ